MAVNGVYVVLGEANALVALLKKARRHWHAVQGPTALEDTDPLLRNLSDLKDDLNKVSELSDMFPSAFLSPFLEIIKSQNTNGPITEAALSSVARFLNYGLIDSSSIKAANAVESIAQAVTHTKFIGGANAGSDECVLFKILQVLRSLLLSPVGRLLSNESVCDMMQSCFRICFEQHLSEMLRKAAEATLSDMTQLIFTRLPTFEEDIRHPYIRKLVMNAKGDKRRRRRKRKSLQEMKREEESGDDEGDVEVVQAKETEKLLIEDSASTASKCEERLDVSASLVESQHMVDVNARGMGYDVVLSTGETVDCVTPSDTNLPLKAESNPDAETDSEDTSIPVVTSLQRERRMSTPADDSATQTSTLQMPYGLPCARELLRFLIALTNPLDRANTEAMIVLGLNLLVVALESSADHLAHYPFLLPLLKDDLCRALLQLLDTEKLPILAATSRACFLLFESMRSQLKFQLEAYFSKLRAIVVSEQVSYETLTDSNRLKSSVSYEKKEIALESIVQMWRIPGLVTELYLNYDCDLYCSNVFEELTKLLVENAFPVSGLLSTSLLSLDALLVVIENIEQNCVYRDAGAMPPSGLDVKSTSLQLPMLSGFESGKKQNENKTEVDAVQASLSSRSNRHANPNEELSMSKVIEQKKRKRIFADGTDLFNQSPKKGIEFLREKSLLGSDAQSVVQWLRENPRLDKKKIADYICSRKHADVLEAFVKSFAFAGTRLDDALRMFLETFRLPGEAAEISMVMQHFSEHWYQVNNEPFNHVDAAFTLSYAIIMLNTDQHNPQVRRNQPPMTVDCFKRNLSGTNGNGNFDPQMLEDVYAAIKNEEIVMPAEQTGLVKENYMWKVLMRRGETSEGSFTHAPTGWNDHDLFSISWGPAIAALSYVFDKSQNDIILKKAVNGYRKCASIAAHYGMSDVFDNLIIHLCKFSTLMTGGEGAVEENLEMQRQRSLNENLPNNSPEGIAIALGENQKAHMAARAVFELVHSNGDILREGWKNVLDCLLHLFRARLLPSDLTEVEDFVDPKGWVSIQRQHQKHMPQSRSDTGLLSWFGLGGGASDGHTHKKPTPEQENLIKVASHLIQECHPGQIVGDSKYLTSSALSELLTALSQASQSIVQHVDVGAQNTQKAKALSMADEDALIFHLELIVSISLENKDRISMVWPVVRRHVEWLLSRRFGRNPLLVERSVVGLLRVVNRNLFRDSEQTATDMLKSLALLLTLPPQAMYLLSRQIAFGLHELIRNNAANVHKKDDWAILFSLLEAAGAAVFPDDIANEAVPALADRNAHSEGEQPTSGRATSDDRGYTSEDAERSRKMYASSETVGSDAGSDSARGSVQDVAGRSQEWIHLDHKDAARATEDALRSVLGPRAVYNRGSLVLRTSLGRHEPAAFLKVGETLSFLLRDAAHVTPDNFDSCVQCLRTFVEASLDGGRYAAGPLSGDAQNRLHSTMTEHGRKKEKHHKGKELSMEVEGEREDPHQEEKQLSASYSQMSHQLLDLCHTLHIKAPTIYASWAGEGAVDASTAALWGVVWRPLLQAMARLCCDCRRQIRAQALNNLVRALITDLQSMTSPEWDSCFGEVLFPLLGKLLEPFSPMDPLGMEETRVRAIQLVAKTLLNHLTLLATLPSFAQLWLRLLDFMEKYLRVERSELLGEAVPESLKNMLLVLDSTGMFSAVPGLFQITVDRMANVLPQLIKEALPNPPPAPLPSSTPSTASLAATPPSSSARKVILAPVGPGTNPVGAPSVSEDSSVADLAEQMSTAASISESVLPATASPSEATPSSPNAAQSPTTSDATCGDVSQPVTIPEVPLTEVVVLSGATSPVLSSSPPESSSKVAEAIAQAAAEITTVETAEANRTLQEPEPTIPVSVATQQQPYYQPQQQAYYHQQQHAYPQNSLYHVASQESIASGGTSSQHTTPQHQPQMVQTTQQQQQQYAAYYHQYDPQMYQHQQQFGHPYGMTGYPTGAAPLPYSAASTIHTQSTASQPSYIVDPNTAMAANPLAGIQGLPTPQVPSGAYSAVNPLPIPSFHLPQTHSQPPCPVAPSQPTHLAASPNSAFTYVHDLSRHPHVPPSIHQNYFQPIQQLHQQPPPQ